MEENIRLFHPFPAVCDSNSKILILGSFPSVKSRENQFYYGHPNNRFWKVLSAVFGEEIPSEVSEKKAFLLSHGIALWDSIASCEIKGSDDTSIKNAVPNDIAALIEKAQISKVFVNGKAAEKVYKRFCEKATGITATLLPSTSPANAAYSLERLIEEWAVIRKQ